MNIDIQPAGEDARPRLRKVLADYLAELGQYGNIGPDYPYFDLYWQEADSRWPYLFLRDGEWIGFALVNTWSPSGRGTDFAVAEFGILPEARGGGAGRAAAVALLQARPGLWELGILPRNGPAMAFWPAVIAAAGAGDIERFEVEDDVTYRFRIG